MATLNDFKKQAISEKEFGIGDSPTVLIYKSISGNEIYYIEMLSWKGYITDRTLMIKKEWRQFKTMRSAIDFCKKLGFKKIELRI